MSATFKVKFWGVRGSIPDPLTNSGFMQILKSLRTEYARPEIHKGLYDIGGFMSFVAKRLPVIYGGNTSCVEIVALDPFQRFVCDMGTGIRLLGNSLMKEMFDNQGLEIVFLLSHVHWDHIQGLPFFAPLFMNKDNEKCPIKNRWYFCGGTNWQKSAEVCLAGQMDAPNFPVSWDEIKEATHRMTFQTVRDHFAPFPSLKGLTSVKARKLNHPQETYGWRLTRDNKTVVYATDNEPNDPRYPSPSLVDLSQNADLLIIDCQYSDHVYHGGAGPVRYGWGHSYPEAVARVAAVACVKNVALFHHDPGATTQDIESRVLEVKEHLSVLKYDCNVFAAYEGLEFSV